MKIIDLFKNFANIFKILIDNLRIFNITNSVLKYINFIDYIINIRILKKRELIRKVNKYPMILNFEEKGISTNLLINRKREIAETELIKKIIKPNMKILEVGGNIGYYTILMGKLVGKSGKIFTFEPYPHSFNLLKRNIKVNHLEKIVESYNLAVSDQDSIKKLYLGDASNLHSLVEFNPKHRKLIFIKVKTIDIYKLLEKLKKIDFLRMDIEGHEREIFNRLNKEIKSYLPKWIFFEIHPIGKIDPDPSFEKPLNNILDLGYIPELIISSSNINAYSSFKKLNYLPSNVIYNNNMKVYVYNNIQSEDLFMIAARRPKITRAILLKLNE